jgi:hypothetical protein
MEGYMSDFALTDKQVGEIADTVQHNLIYEITKCASCLDMIPSVDELIDIRLADHNCPDDNSRPGERASESGRSRIFARTEAEAVSGQGRAGLAAAIPVE